MTTTAIPDYAKRRKAPMPKGTWAFCRIFCKQGHYLAPANVMANHGRRCRQCFAAASKANKLANFERYRELAGIRRRRDRTAPWIPDLTPKAIERFMAFVEPEPNTGCWLWFGAVARQARQFQYGRFSNARHQVSAHRYSYIAFVGPIPDGLHLLHRCDTPPCVNPSHLSLGTHRDNMLDAKRKGKLFGRPA